MPSDSSDCNVFVYSLHFILCGFGVITNGLSVAVFLSPKLKDPSFKYLLIISIADFIYCGLSTFYFANYCNTFYLNRSYETNNFYIIRRYLICVCAFFNLLVEIFMGFDRYMLLLNKRFLKSTSYKWLLPILLLISAIIYAPYLIVYEIIPYSPNNSTIYYKTTKSQIGKAILGQGLVIAINVVRAILILIVLTTINILIANEFKKRYNLKKQNQRLSNLKNYFYLKIFIFISNYISKNRINSKRIKHSKRDNTNKRKKSKSKVKIKHK